MNTRYEREFVEIDTSYSFKSLRETIREMMSRFGDWRMVTLQYMPGVGKLFAVFEREVCE